MACHKSSPGKRGAGYRYYRRFCPLPCSGKDRRRDDVRFFECVIEESFFKKLDEAKDYLNSSRPTAVNLSWALGRVEKRG